MKTLFLAGAIALTATAAQAALRPMTITVPCGAYTEVKEMAQAKFGETARSSRGVASQNHVMETLVDPTDNSWTILVVRTDGLACVIASGSALEVFEPEAPGEGS